MGETCGWAVKQMQNGSRVRRSGWNGKGMWLILVTPNDSRQATRMAESMGMPAGENLRTLPWIGMKTADNAFVPWLCSQTDLLAVDWEIAG
jgi:hypothetical protein